MTIWTKMMTFVLKIWSTKLQYLSENWNFHGWWKFEDLKNAISQSICVIQTGLNNNSPSHMFDQNWNHKLKKFKNEFLISIFLRVKKFKMRGHQVCESDIYFIICWWQFKCYFKELRNMWPYAWWSRKKFDVWINWKNLFGYWRLSKISQENPRISQKLLINKNYLNFNKF